MVAAAIIAICEFTWRKRKLAVDENTSVWREMWGELKFAINPFAGDTKPNPMECDSQVASRASSKAMLSKSTAESLHKYGQIGDELSLTKVWRMQQKNIVTRDTCNRRNIATRV